MSKKPKSNNRDAAFELPLGLGMALAQYPEAMQGFSQLDESARAELVRRAKNAGSRDEMQALVSALPTGDMASTTDYTGAMPFMPPEYDTPEGGI